MNLLLSDRTLPAGLPANEENRYIDLSEMKIANCVGCFGCWVKTPGKCVIRDDAGKVYPLIAQSRRALYVSRLYCGSYDIPMKTMLERAIPVQQAFIRIHGGETHHVQRDVAEKEAVIIAYGDICEEEKALFRRLAGRNAHNMSFRKWDVRFVPEEEVDGAICGEVQKWESC
jgi:multimeric flavodoxin WrbA